MEYLVGALMMVLFFAVFYAGHYLGSRKKRPTKEPDETERYKAERLRQGFQQLMSYDVSKAVGKRVNE